MVKTGISLDSVKNNNKSQILKILQKNGAMSRKDIANQIGLTPAAVTMLCNDMMEAHMILEKGEMKEQKRAGRKKVLVDINYDFKYIVSVNIEAVDTSITVTNIRGNVLVEAKVHTRTDIEPQLFLEELAKEIKLQLWEKELKLSDILGIGICVPGIVDRNNGISIHAYGIWDNQVKIREILEKQIQCPVILENNVTLYRLIIINNIRILVYGITCIFPNILTDISCFGDFVFDIFQFFPIVRQKRQKLSVDIRISFSHFTGSAI